MAKRANTVLDLIGETPIVHLQSMTGENEGEVWAKLEYMNPGGSIKDRTCLGMILAAEESGELKPGATIVEPTAGNTGVGLALIGVSRGYRVVCIMPEKFLGEKSTLIQALGGEVIKTPTEKGMKHAIALAEEMVAEDENTVTMAQFSNPANPSIHEETTGPEIVEQMDEDLHAIVAGAGTGGTFTGLARCMKRRLPECERVLVQPDGSVFDGSEYHSYQVEGIGSNFIPATLEVEIATSIETIPDTETFQTVKDLARKEGLLVGGSSGAICAAAIRVAKRLGPGKKVVCIFPDAAERYLSKFQFDVEA